MNKKLKYILLIIVGILLIPFYKTADAETANGKKEINLPLGKTIEGEMISGTTDTYVFKPTQIGKLTITITNYIKDYTSACLYSDENADNKLVQGGVYNEAAGCSTIKFDVYVNPRTYYLDLSNQFLINGGSFKITTKFSTAETIDSEQINSSAKTSISLYNNKSYQGILTCDEAENYYSINFSKKSLFKLKITSLDEAVIDITIIDSKGKVIYNDWCFSDSKIFSYSEKLPKGKYYIVVKKGGKEYQLGRKYQMVTGSYVAIKSISIPSKKTMKIGDTYTFKPTLKPADATGDYTFSTSDNKIVKVSKNTGMITGMKKGTAVITVKTVDGKIKSTCKITVTGDIPVSKITLSKTKVTLHTGDKVTLTATVTPKDATKKTVTWKSSNQKIATVNSSGIVTAKSAGNCKITATADGKSVTASIEVSSKPVITPKPTQQPTSKPVPIEVNSISMQSSLKLTVGDSSVLTVNIIPGNAHDKTITWSSTDSSIVTVENGTIQCKKVGNATIIATSSNGKKAYCTVLVGD